MNPKLYGEFGEIFQGPFEHASRLPGAIKGT